MLNRKRIRTSRWYRKHPSERFPFEDLEMVQWMAHHFHKTFRRRHPAPFNKTSKGAARRTTRRFVILQSRSFFHACES